MAASDFRPNNKQWPASLTFTSANWNTAQTVTVTGVNDDVADGNILYTIITATAAVMKHEKTN